MSSDERDMPFGMRVAVIGACLALLGAAMLARSLRDSEERQRELQSETRDAGRRAPEGRDQLDGALATISEIRREHPTSESADAGSL